MDRVKTDILIAGGGIAGLSAAAAFAAEGFGVICVDPAPPPATAEAEGADLRSTALLMPAVALLERAGLWQAIAAQAAALRVMRIADAGGREAAIRDTADFTATEVGAQVFGYNVPNWRLRHAFAARLSETTGARLAASLSVERVTARSAHARVLLSDGCQVEAALVVAADGRDSPVRTGLGTRVRHWSYGQKALAFTVSHDRPHEGVSTEIHRTGGPFTLVPLPDAGGRAHSAVIWMDRGSRIQALAGLAPEAFSAVATRRSCDVLGPLRLASARRVWPIVTQVADRLDGPRTALIAEAAHVIPPIGAQGLNMSLRDVATLRDLCLEARAAGRDIGAPELLARYHGRRHPDILARAMGVDLLNRAAMAGPQPLRDLRHLGLRALHGIAPARQLAIRLGLGTA